MNSIINPWVFYWIGIVDSVRTLLIVILTVLMIGGAIMFMCTMSDADDRGFKDKDVAEEVKLCIKVAIATFVVAVLVCVVPSEDTCYKMLAADMFTQDMFLPTDTPISQKSRMANSQQHTIQA